MKPWRRRHPQPTALELATGLVRRFEGCELTAYLDVGGVPTIGWGATYYPSGQPVRLGDHISQAMADAMLALTVAGVMDSVEKLTQGPTSDPPRVPSANQLAAMVSLCYNIGTTGFASSTVLRDWIAGDDAAAANAFLLWDKVQQNGVLVVVPGLLARRQAERAVFLS